MISIPAGPISRILLATTYAIATTAYTILTCAATNHPTAHWTNGTRSCCRCGAKWR